MFLFINDQRGMPVIFAQVVTFMGAGKNSQVILHKNIVLLAITVTSINYGSTLIDRLEIKIR